MAPSRLLYTGLGASLLALTTLVADKVELIHLGAGPAPEVETATTEIETAAEKVLQEAQAAEAEANARKTNAEAAQMEFALQAATEAKAIMKRAAKQRREEAREEELRQEGRTQMRKLLEPILESAGIKIEIQRVPRGMAIPPSFAPQRDPNMFDLEPPSDKRLDPLRHDNSWGDPFEPKTRQQNQLDVLESQLPKFDAEQDVSPGESEIDGAQLR